MALVFVSLNIFAQTPPVLPLDPKVKTGKLENGLTYFVMQNAEPKGQAEFYIAQKVGSILEEENQRGLAHFLEHMAFNGTKNYPGNKVISYLETIGVKFGANLNAYTAIDQTVYNISAVPLKREGIVDSCLLILHDWANEILLEEEDIDKERGVIREELRTRNNAQMRMLENLLPEILPDSKYAHRLPGGLVEVINTFTYQELRDYYEKWYRPDLQGIIVVGDIDPAVIEQKIVKMFSDIPKPVNAAERTEFEVPDNTQPLIGIASDPE
ncbi:MAG: M16 family metallopeptidase, partial [Bacteroidales bacterium]